MLDELEKSLLHSGQANVRLRSQPGDECADMGETGRGEPLSHCPDDVEHQLDVDRTGGEGDVDGPCSGVLCNPLSFMGASAMVMEASSPSSASITLTLGIVGMAGTVPVKLGACWLIKSLNAVDTSTTDGRRCCMCAGSSSST